MAANPVLPTISERLFRRSRRNSSTKKTARATLRSVTQRRIVERIRKSPYGRISCRFRVRDRQGKYDWRECIAILLSSGTHPLMLTATWVVEAPTLLPEGTAATSKDFAALLWQSF